MVTTSSCLHPALIWCCYSITLLLQSTMMRPFIHSSPCCLLTQLLAPPSLLPTFQDWVAKAGHPTALQGPKAVWLPEALPTVRATPATAKALDSSSSTSTERLQPESGSQSPSATSGVAATIRSESVLVVAAAGWLLVLSIL